MYEPILEQMYVCVCVGGIRDVSRDGCVAFLAVPWVCLRFVIVVFPDCTHLLFWMLHENSTHARSPVVQVTCPFAHTVTGLHELCTEESEKVLH